MGYYINVEIGGKNYRYICENVKENYKIIGRNKTIYISKDGKTFTGDIQRVYVRIIYKAIQAKERPFDVPLKRKEIFSKQTKTQLGDRNKTEG